MSPGAFVVEDKESYLHQLEASYVIVDPAKRRKIIIEQIEQIAKEKGGSVLKDDELIDTVTFLVEYPVAICGDFDKKYQELPKDILINAMKEHQKYFSIIDKNCCAECGAVTDILWAALIKDSKIDSSPVASNLSSLCLNFASP